MVEDLCPRDKCVESNGDFLSAVEHRNGVYYSEFVVGVCGSVLQTQTLFQTKICHFLYPFSDLFLKIHTIFTVVLLSPYPCFIFRLSD